MKPSLRLTLLLASLLISVSQQAQAQGLSMFGDSPDQGSAAPSLALPPLSWQKLNYEEKILESLKKDIAVVIPPEQFVLTVQIKLKEPVLPKPAPPQEAPPPAAAEGDPGILGGDDLMSKLGVDSPSMSPDELKKKEDLFENIAGISIELMLDARVDKTREDIVKKLIQLVAPTVKKVKAEVKVTRLALTVEPEKPKPEPVKQPEMIDWVKEFKEPGGRIISLGIFAFFVFIVSFLAISKLNALGRAAIDAFKEYTAFQQEASNGKSVSSSNLEVASVSSGGGTATTAHKHHEEAPEDEAASALISSQHDKELAGIEKFKKLVTTNPQSASMFVRQWIKIRPEGSMDALIILTRSIQPENLVQLFDLMSVDERKTLSKILNSPLSKDALGRADLFLNNQIIMDLITPKPNLAPAMQELLMGITDEEIASVSQKNIKGAAALLNLLPAAQMIKIADTLPIELCEQIFPVCAVLSSDEALKQIESVKTLLVELRGQGEQAASPFIESVPELMSTASLNKERVLYTVLANSKQWSTIDKLAQKQFPATLVAKLPVEVLKEVVLLLPNVKRAELIVSQEEPMKSTLLSCAGEPGKKLRDMLDLEVRDIESNADRKEKITSASDKIWMDFVKVVRQALKSEPNFAKPTKAVLAEWQEELRGLKETSSATTGGGSDSSNSEAA